MKKEGNANLAYLSKKRDKLSVGVEWRIVKWPQLGVHHDWEFVRQLYDIK